jgi:creatinine amidohydrolase/Fe(II)-dependent formamide hydrolase-like protein
MKIGRFILLALMWPTMVRSQPSLLIEELTWPEVRAAIASGKTTAIYLAGSVEESGPHMVLGKHNILARYEALAIARELGNALVYPVMPFAPTGDPIKKDDLMEFPGSISIADKTFGLVARDVALSAISAGFKNVVLMGEHGGGQDALKEIAASLDARWSSKGIHVYYVGYKEVDRQIAEYCKANGLVVGEHAGVPDTSRLLFIDTQGMWVRRDKMAPGGEWSKTGVDGDPTQASAELGERFMAMCVQGWSKEIRRLIDKGK